MGRSWGDRLALVHMLSNEHQAGNPSNKPESETPPYNPLPTPHPPVIPGKAVVEEEADEEDACPSPF